MHLCAFTVIFVPKLFTMVTPVCPLCTAVSQMNSPMAQTYLNTKLCMDVSLTTEVMAIFVIFLPYFGQNLVAMATSLRLLQSEMSSLDWSTLKTILEPNILSIAVIQAKLCRFEGSRQV